MSIRSWIPTLIPVLALTLPACGGGQNEAIRFAADLPSDQSERIQADLNRLAELRMTEAGDAEFQALFGLAGLNGAEILPWLQERVRYVIPESYDFNRHVRVLGEAVYPSTPLPPPAESPRVDWQIETSCQRLLESPEAWERFKHLRDGRGPGTVVMSNAGASFYLWGKENGIRVAAAIAGHGKVEVRSPRVGIIQVGEGLFRAGPGGTEAAALWRLEVLLHEARHSDGNGESTGFLHELCPPGHALAGVHACDFNLNGPYTVGAQALKRFTEDCDGCELSVADREALRLAYLDSFDRVVSERRRVEPCSEARGMKELQFRAFSALSWFIQGPESEWNADSARTRCEGYVSTVGEIEKALEACPAEVSVARALDPAPEGR